MRAMRVHNLAQMRALSCSIVLVALTSISLTSQPASAACGPDPKTIPSGGLHKPPKHARKSPCPNIQEVITSGGLTTPDNALEQKSARTKLPRPEGPQVR
jgi:hypothetical protein